MKLSPLQRTVLGKLRLTKPMSASEIRRACGYTGSDRTFAAALRRMSDKGLIACHFIGRGTDPAMWTATEHGAGVFFDNQAPL